MSLPDHVHGSSPRLKEVGGVLDPAHVAQNALPHRLQKAASAGLNHHKGTTAQLRQRALYPHLLRKASLLLRQLHSSAAPGAEVLRSRNHLPVLKLEVPHQQLQRSWRGHKECFTLHRGDGALPIQTNTN